jgi:hypothetical protein
VTNQITLSQVVSGLCVCWKIVPAMTETCRLHPRQTMRPRLASQ